MARFCCFRESCPEWLPPSGLFCPAPVRWLWYLRIQDQWLVPQVGLKASPLDVLFKGCLGWRDVLQSPGLLGEKVFPGIVYLHAFTGSVVHQHHKSFHQWPWSFTDLTWHGQEFLQSISDLWERLPSLPCSPLSSASKCRDSVTPMQWKRERRRELGTVSDSLWQPFGEQLCIESLTRNWKDFLRCDENKTELFSFLTCLAVQLPLAQGSVCNRWNWSPLLSRWVMLGQPCPMFARGGQHYFCMW